MRGPPPPRAYTFALVCCFVDSLRGSSVKLGTTQRRLAWRVRKDDTHKSRSVNKVNSLFVSIPVSEQNTPPEKRMCEKVSCRSTESGGG